MHVLSLVENESLEFSYENFKEIEDDIMRKAMFKYAISQHIKNNRNLSKEERIELAVKHQVLTNETAFVGKIK